MFQSQSFPGPWHQMPQLTISPVTVSHTGAPSPTSASHVGDGSTNSTGYVDNLYLTIVSHAGGTTLVATSHINATSLTSKYHAGDDSPTFTFHVDSMPPVVLNNTGGIEKPRHLRRKPKFLCKTYEGSHITHLFQATTGIPEAWGLPKGLSNSKESMVSPHIVPLIDITATPLQSSLDHNPIFKGDLSPIPIILHPLQPRIEEMVVPMKSLVNPTPFAEGDASFNHVVNIPDLAPSERERALLSSNPLPPGFEETTFDWSGLVGYPMPLPMFVPVRDIIWSITKTIYYVTSLSS
jgi:hypothetical protein